MKLDHVRNYLKNLTRLMELLIACLVIVGLLLAFAKFIGSFAMIIGADSLAIYEVFQNFLSFVLLLFVGIELIHMIVFHSADSVLQLVLFVIARKMLIYASSMTDLLLGSVAIAVICFTLYYLVNGTPLKRHVGDRYESILANEEETCVERVND